MTRPLWSLGDLSVRTVRSEDIEPLTAFECSLGHPWEDAVQDEVRERLADRYLRERDGVNDPRMLMFLGPSREILAVAAHYVIEVPAVLPDGRDIIARPTYLEVVAVGLTARRTTVDVGDRGSPL